MNNTNEINMILSKEFEHRPWGCYYVIHDEPTYKLKRIEVLPKGSLSYQYHHKRSEAWTIVEGTGTITLDGVKQEYSAGMTILIPQGAKHRIENFTDKKVVFIEVQTGTYFGEDDIVRLDDIYNRV
jgi:mannose-6-phosphate isomerase